MSGKDLVLFLGTGRVANQHKKFATYHEAQKWAQEQKITSSNQWTNKKDRPSHIPSLPEVQYKSQWKGWASFLGLEKTIPKKKKIFLSYKKAQQWAKEHDIATVAQWYAYSNKPKSLPYHPDRTYKNEGWVSWSHFLGIRDDLKRLIDVSASEFCGHAHSSIKEIYLHNKEFDKFLKSIMPNQNLTKKI